MGVIQAFSYIYVLICPPTQGSLHLLCSLLLVSLHSTDSLSFCLPHHMHSWALSRITSTPCIILFSYPAYVHTCTHKLMHRQILMHMYTLTYMYTHAYTHSHVHIHKQTAINLSLDFMYERKYTFSCFEQLSLHFPKNMIIAKKSNLQEQYLKLNPWYKKT